MSVKLHLLRSHLEYFPKNCENMRQKQGEHFHQRYLHYGRVLPRLVRCKLSCWQLQVLETECGGCWAEEEVPKKTFHPWIASFVYFSVYYGTTWAFCEYISHKFNIIFLLNSINSYSVLCISNKYLYLKNLIWLKKEFEFGIKNFFKISNHIFDFENIADYCYSHSK